MQNNNTTKNFFLIFTIFSLLVITPIFFAGCSPQEDISSKNRITFTDALHRTVTLKKEPQRVAALLGSFADIWCLAGGSICATAEDAWDDFGLALPDAINIGGAHSPNLELLLSANPDFVIASASTASNVEMLEVLEAAGITVAYFDVDNFEDYLSMLKLCTDITGRKDLYEKNGLSIQRQIAQIKMEVANSPLSEQKRTVLLLRTHSGSVKAKGSTGTILGEMLADLGCINIADSDTSLLENLSIESIMQQEPYHIFAVTMGDDTEKAIANLYQMIEENPAWQTLDAITSKRLYLMERKLFNMKPNARWAESYEKLSEILLEKN